MIAIQSNEVKTRFAEVLRKVESGQEVGITRHGKLIAKLLPCGIDARDPSSKQLAIQKLKAFRKHKLAAGETIADWRDEGRR
ncbi:MAG: type II toxin-antitoxin system prevent-host-death family antitoxin [Thiothrix sp.]|nr:MAG: type II toxin-antitoxin system prevent-host-death family antitoxin [Thiothrix sp.]